MRLYFSTHIPRTPFRVGFITGPFGRIGDSKSACETCGRKPVNALVGWGYILICMGIGAGAAFLFMSWFGR